MKTVLITGQHGYIGNALEAYLRQWPERYRIERLSLRNGLEKIPSLAQFDCIVHAAGIAHRKEGKEPLGEYEAVNRDLTISLAQRAKEDGAGQFIFLSTMSVYGMDVGRITGDTPPRPTGRYGRTKLEAEERLTSLREEGFRVAVLRPPMVYGYGCKGNFQALAKFVRCSPVFPAVRNKRSLIYIENLCAFIREVIDRNCDGLFFPQDPAYGCTSEIAGYIAAAYGKKLVFSHLAGLAVLCLRPFSRTVRKAFGTLIYEQTEAPFCADSAKDLAEAVRESVLPPSTVFPL